MSYIAGGSVPIQDPNNSSATPLAGSATFTGAWSLAQRSMLVIQCLTDAPGTIFVDFSVDGSNADSTFPVNGFSVNANIPTVQPVALGSRYYRVRLVNDAGAQSFLRLGSGFSDITNFYAPLNQPLGAESAALLTRTVDAILDISANRFSGFTPLSRKFGRATAVQTTRTDLWDRANTTNTQYIWAAPTAARVHALVSADANDTNAAGTGARKVEVFGLQTWDSVETSEVVNLNGTTPVNTANSYVIIHRMRVTEWGALGPNIGIITATAATDGTVTAQITAERGSTQMAIYGIGSSQTIYITKWTASIQKSSGATADAEFALAVNSQPDTQPIGFVEVDNQGLQSDGSSSYQWDFIPYLEIQGPAIIKQRARGSTNGIQCSGGFSGIIVNN